MKTTTGSSRTSSRTATCSTGSRCVRRSAITTPRETEEHDDREQVMDNFYLRERLSGEEAAGRASVGPGLFYRFRISADVEFVCFDTSKEDFFRRGRLFEYPEALGLSCSARFQPREAGGIRWRIPFGHHPPYCAGPQHSNTDHMAPVVALFEAAEFARASAVTNTTSSTPARTGSTISSRARAARSGDGRLAASRPRTRKHGPGNATSSWSR